MHGVAPQCVVKVAYPSLGREAGGRSPPASSKLHSLPPFRSFTMQHASFRRSRAAKRLGSHGHGNLPSGQSAYAPPVARKKICAAKVRFSSG
jgi:hypothetical protein